MPIEQPPLSRRRFLEFTAVGSAALYGAAMAHAAADGGGDRFALLSDTHIPGSADVVARDANMTSNLRQVVQQVVALSPRPAAALINGDCAYLKGEPADYANLAQLVHPLAEHGIPLHLTMGNHDDRQPLYDALRNVRANPAPVDHKHVTVIESAHANWFLLDSLTEVNVVTGELGAAQRQWLTAALDARPDKPALLVVHHNPQFTPPTNQQPWSGIRDTDALLELVRSHSQVKAIVFGHTHTWEVSQRDRLWLINLPPVAYVFSKGRPNGWVDAQLRADGMQLTLHTLDPQHPLSQQQFQLNWN